MLNIGCHLSASQGFLSMAHFAFSIGANTFQFFLRSPKSGRNINFFEDDIDEFKKFCKENQFAPIVAHSPYTINLCSSRPEVRKSSHRMLKDDLKKMQNIPGNFYNIHPGSHTGLGIKKGIQLISNAIGEILSEDFNTTLVLETMAGKGTEIGSSFDELSEIINQSGNQKNLGVCFDTCHMFDAGFDFNKLDEILFEFDKKIGINKLKILHLNDSKNRIGSRKDRHERIGQGHIGLEPFKRIVSHNYLKNLPMILETPNDLIGYAEEILILKGLI